MCTLTFIPGLPGGGFLLATNRDESPRRAAAAAPAVQRFGARQVIAPRDPDGGGTWIGVDDTGHCIAILNGDRPLPPGMLPVEIGTLVSRGLLVHDLLEDPRFDSVRNELERRHRLDALHYKPFKLVVVSPGPSHGSGRRAHILRADWDGRTLRMEEEHGPRCIVSSTYEAETVTNARRAAFDRFLHEQSRALERVGQTEAGGAGGASGAGGTSSTGGAFGATSAATARTAGGGGAAGAGGATGATSASGAIGANSEPVEALATALAGLHAAHHAEEPQGGPRSVCMHRDDANTVSSTQVLVTGSQVVMRYRAGRPCGSPAAVATAMPRTS